MSRASAARAPRTWATRRVRFEGTEFLRRRARRNGGSGGFDSVGGMSGIQYGRAGALPDRDRATPSASRSVAFASIARNSCGQMFAMRVGNRFERTEAAALFRAFAIAQDGFQARFG